MIENQFIAKDDGTLQVSLVIDESLVRYFREGMVMDHISGDPNNELVSFLAAILNDTSYPLEAHRTGDTEIQVRYQIRPFADPIF